MYSLTALLSFLHFPFFALCLLLVHSLDLSLTLSISQYLPSHALNFSSAVASLPSLKVDPFETLLLHFTLKNLMLTCSHALNLCTD